MRSWRKQDELSELARELRARRPEPRREFVRALEQRLHEGQDRRSSRRLRLGFVGVLTAAMLTVLGAFGGFGYASSTVVHVASTATHLVTPQKVKVAAGFNAAAAQYGKKASVCTVEPNGKQHTITISQNAVASYLATHPLAYLGACTAGKPKGATANVCLRLPSGKYAAIYVRAALRKSYLKRNPRSFIKTTGKCRAPKK